MADDKELTGQDETLTLEVESIEVDTDVTQAEATKHPVPAAIKFGIPALLLVTVLGVVGAFSFFQKPSQAKVDPLPTPNPATAIDDIAIQTTPIPLPVPKDPDFIDRAVLDRLSQQLDALDQRITESLSQFDRQRDALTQQGERIQEVKAALASNEALISQFGARIDAMGLRITDLAGQVGSNSERLRQASSKAKRKASAKPGFELLSIDHWGQRNSVVFTYQNQTRMVSLGDELAGWTLQSIDAPNCVGLVRQSDRAKSTLCLKEGKG
jgi:hypothetical protein